MPANRGSQSDGVLSLLPTDALSTPRADPTTVRYLGSKTRVVEEIMALIGPPSADAGFFVDAFCGTGIVGDAAADLGWKVRANDHMRSAVALARARLVSRDDVDFGALGGYETAVQALNGAPDVDGFFVREYSPASAEGRMYFTESNARRIDGIRAELRAWSDARLLSAAEHELLIADLITAAARVANTAGTYGCFLTYWSGNATQQFVLQSRELRHAPVEHEITCMDVTGVPVTAEDTVYLDPPYTKRQYAAYYHVNETLAHGDEPALSGRTGLRPWQDRASDFCYKARALPALTQLVRTLTARRIFLSYSSQGHVALDALSAALQEVGAVTVHELGSIGRYRPNRVASGASDRVTEYLIEITKAP